MKHGDIIHLGNHKLMCGDATCKDDINALIGDLHVKMLFTSPPYSDLYNYSGNDLSPSHLANFIPNVKDYADILCVNLGLKKHNNEIISYWDEYIDAAKKAGLKLLAWNVWDKLNPGSISQQQYMFPLRHEFIFVFGKKPIKLNRTIPKHGRRDPRPFKTVREPDGTFKLTTSNPQIHEDYKTLESVISHNSEKRRPVYMPAQMPVKLAEEYIKACSSEGDYILDCFGGSGSTLIACERTNRKCLIMEISQDFCSNIINRYNISFRS